MIPGLTQGNPTSPGDVNGELARTTNEHLARFGARVILFTGQIVDHIPERRRRVAALAELHGDYDTSTSEATALLLRGLLETNDLVVVDLSAVVSIDSMFLEHIVAVQALANEVGSALRVKLGPRDSPARTAFELCGLVNELDCI